MKLKTCEIKKKVLSTIDYYEFFSNDVGSIDQLMKSVCPYSDIYPLRTLIKQEIRRRGDMCFYDFDGNKL